MTITYCTKLLSRIDLFVFCIQQEMIVPYCLQARQFQMPGSSEMKLNLLLYLS